MIDLDIASIDGFTLTLALLGIGLMVLLFGGLTAWFGIAIVVGLAFALRIFMVRFDRWARGVAGSSKTGGADPSEIDWSEFE